MTNGNTSRVELARLLWAGYAFTVQTLWRLRWLVLGLVAATITILIIRH